MDSRIKELMSLLRLSKKSVLEIDEGMWDILIELNKKGWRTLYCCEGHPNTERRWNAYIAFRGDPLFPNLPPMYKKKVAGDRQKVSPFSEYRNGSYYWWGSISKKTTVEQKDAERKEMMNRILEWAKELPYRNENTSCV